MRCYKEGKNYFGISPARLRIWKHWRQKRLSRARAIISHGLMRYVITYACPWYLLLATNSWCEAMMTSSNGNISTLLAISAGNSPVPGEFPAHRPVTRSFNVFFDLRLNKRLSKQSWGWWFETLPCPLWRHCNACCEASIKGRDSND